MAMLANNNSSAHRLVMMVRLPYPKDICTSNDETISILNYMSEISVIAEDPDSIDIDMDPYSGLMWASAFNVDEKDPYCFEYELHSIEHWNEETYTDLITTIKQKLGIHSNQIIHLNLCKRDEELKLYRLHELKNIIDVQNALLASPMINIAVAMKMNPRQNPITFHQELLFTDTITLHDNLQKSDVNLVLYYETMEWITCYWFGHNVVQRDIINMIIRFYVVDNNRSMVWKTLEIENILACRFTNHKHSEILLPDGSFSTITLHMNGICVIWTDKSQKYTGIWNKNMIDDKMNFITFNGYSVEKQQITKRIRCAQEDWSNKTHFVDGQRLGLKGSEKSGQILMQKKNAHEHKIFVHFDKDYKWIQIPNKSICSPPRFDEKQVIEYCKWNLSIPQFWYLQSKCEMDVFLSQKSNKFLHALN
eukprot:442568_1